MTISPCPECGGMGWPNGAGPDHGYEGPCHGGPHIADWARFVRAQLEDAAAVDGGELRLAAIAHAAVDGGVSYLIDRASTPEDYYGLPASGTAIFFGGDEPPKIDWAHPLPKQQ